MKIRNSLFILLFIGIASIAYAYLVPMADGTDPWPVPDKFEKMKNPVKSDAASIADGKALWTKHCASCHGKKGMGDGTKAAQLETDPGNFTAASFKKQTDGAIFFKTQTGRDDMPSFKKKLPEDEDIWHLVNYIRSL